MMGLLVPTILLFFSLTFLLVWLGQRAMRHTLAVAVSFFVMGLGVVLAQYVFPPGDLLNIIVPLPVTAFAVSLGISAMCRRSGVETPFGMLCFVSTAGTLLSSWATIAFPSLNAQGFMLNFTFAGLFASGAYSLWPNRSEGMVDRLLLVTAVTVAAQLVILPFFTLTGGVALTSETFHSSTYWFAMNLVLVVSALAFAVSLLAACAADAFADAKKEAQTDLLSGLNDRRAFDEAARRIFAKLERSPLPVSLVICDIDHFKAVNDTYGHQVGDAVIGAFGDMLSGFARESDLTGRIGGEEFGIVLWNTSVAGARLFAETLRSAVQSYPAKVMPEDLKLSASFGVAQVCAGEAFDDVYRRADEALYRAKRAGRDRVVVDMRSFGAQRVA